MSTTKEPTMNPSDMTAAQLLDATIEAMVEAGPEGWLRGSRANNSYFSADGTKACLVGRAARVIRGTPKQAELILSEPMKPLIGGRFPCQLNDSATDFDDLIAKLRQIKSAL